MHVHRLWGNENECKKQRYQIKGNNSFQRLDILSTLLHFISSNIFFQKILKHNKRENIFVKDFLERRNFQSNFNQISNEFCWKDSPSLPVKMIAYEWGEFGLLQRIELTRGEGLSPELQKYKKNPLHNNDSIL